MLRHLLGIATLWVAVVAVFFACQRLFPDHRESTFSDYEAGRGAMPLYSPRSAVGIRMRSMTQSSASWLSFRAPTPDIAAMLRSCARVPDNAVEYTQHSPPPWWPTILARGAKKTIRSTNTTGASGGRARANFTRGDSLRSIQARPGLRVAARLIQERRYWPVFKRKS